jgi:hypothetical protein
MENIASENKLLIALSKIALSEDDIFTINNLILSIKNWPNIYEAAVMLGIGSLISRHLIRYEQKDTIPKIIISKFNQLYYRSFSRNIILYEHFKKIHQAFEVNKIEIIPLKGIYLAETYYKDIGLRQMTDIDLLVKQEDVEKCIKILMNLGYKAAERVKTEFIKHEGAAKHLPTMVLNGVFIEIHYRILIDNSTYFIDIGNYWKNTNSIILYNTPTLALSPENLLQYLCIHLERHFNEGKIQLYQFVDLLGILQKHEKGFNWDDFVISCEKSHCIKNVFRVLFLLQKFFLVSFPEKIQQIIIQYSNISTENLFISFLNCQKEEISAQIETQNLKNLRKIRGLKNKFRYLYGDIFPSKSFMVSRYAINKKHPLFFFYMVRFLKGFIILIRHVLRKLSFRK